MTPEQTKKLADAVLARSRADEAHVSLTGGTTSHLRFSRNSPSTSGAMSNPSVSIRSTFGRRSGTVRINQFDSASVDKAMRRSEEIAKYAPEDPEQLPGIGPQEYEEVSAFFADDTAAKKMANGVATCIRESAASKLVSAGFTEAHQGYEAVANSKGMFAHHKSSSAYVSATVRTPDGGGSGWSSQAGNRVGELDFDTLTKIAIDKAKRSVDPKPLEPGKYVTILEPACVASLVRSLVSSMGARRADEGRSYFSANGGNRLGEELFPSSINIYSDPADPAAPSRPWSGTGLPQTKRHWIKDGVVETLSYDRYWARTKGVEPVPFPSNTIVAGGEGSLEDLIASNDKGVLVTSLWYIRSVDPRTMLLTGLTRDGVFWIENGKISHPVKNFRWNDSPIAVLKNAVAMSKPVRVPPRGSRSGTTVVPAIKVKEFKFSSVSDAV
jgi:predicted Zn-dependent protease